MKRGPNQAFCCAHGRIAAFGDQKTLVDLGGAGWLGTDGPLGPRPITTGAADLLDVATVVYRVERQLQKRGPSNPNVKYELTIPLRDPALWSGRPKQLVEELLGFLGSTQWELNIVHRPSKASGFSKVEHSAPPVRRVALFSGGLDSACGTGAGLVSPSDTDLCSFYSRQKGLQRHLAADLGFSQRRAVAGYAVRRPSPRRRLFRRYVQYLSRTATIAPMPKIHQQSRPL